MFIVFPHSDCLNKWKLFCCIDWLWIFIYFIDGWENWKFLFRIQNNFHKLNETRTIQMNNSIVITIPFPFHCNHLFLFSRDFDMISGERDFKLAVSLNSIFDISLTQRDWNFHLVNVVHHSILNFYRIRKFNWSIQYSSDSRFWSG